MCQKKDIYDGVEKYMQKIKVLIVDDLKLVYKIKEISD
jgi:hypothetical protein